MGYTQRVEEVLGQQLGGPRGGEQQVYKAVLRRQRYNGTGIIVSMLNSVLLRHGEVLE